MSPPPRQWYELPGMRAPGSRSAVGRASVRVRVCLGPRHARSRPPFLTRSILTATGLPPSRVDELEPACSVGGLRPGSVRSRRAPRSRQSRAVTQVPTNGHRPEARSVLSGEGVSAADPDDAFLSDRLQPRRALSGRRSYLHAVLCHIECGAATFVVVDSVRPCQRRNRRRRRWCRPTRLRAGDQLAEPPPRNTGATYSRRPSPMTGYCRPRSLDIWSTWCWHFLRRLPELASAHGPRVKPCRI